jgi:hypothetical protein
MREETMLIEISRSIAREILGVDREVSIEFTYDGPAALPNCYKWRGPTGTAWARIRCEGYEIDYENRCSVETPKRSYGRLGRAHEGYADCIYGGGYLVRCRYRCGRNDPKTQRAAAEMLLDVLHDRFSATELGQLAGLKRAA